MIKAVIFDLDGVVVDSEPLYQAAEERLFARYGVTIPPEDWALFRGSTEQRFYQLVRDRYGVDLPVEQLRIEGRAEVLAAFERALAFNDGFEVLHNQLRSDYALGLVTSTPPSIFVKMDERLGIRDLFDHIITGDMTANNKPHPEPYLAMLKKLGVEPGEAIVVEDSMHGIMSAWAAGTWTVALTGSIPEVDMPERHATIHHLEQLTPDLFDRITGTAPVGL